MGLNKIYDLPELLQVSILFSINQKSIFDYRKGFYTLSSIIIMMEKIEQYGKGRADTILCKVETDSQFLQEIREIADKKKSMRHELFDEKKKEINDFEIDEIHSRALKHMEANILNQNTIINHQQNRKDGDYCLCGCKKEKGGSLPLLVDEQKISFLGSGALLVFFYLRHVRLLMALCFMIFGCFCVISNTMIAGEGIPSKCQVLGFQSYCSFSTRASSISIKDNQMLKIYQSALGCIMCLIWMTGVRIIWTLGFLKDQNIDDSLESDSDYHVMISNLPYGESEQSQILEYIEHIWANNGGQIAERGEGKQNVEGLPELNIKSIQLMYNMKQGREVIDDMSCLAIEIEGCLRNDSYRFSNLIKEEKIEEYRGLKKAYYLKFDFLTQMRRNFYLQKEERKKLSTTCALLEFETQEEQKKFLRILGTKKNPILSAFLPNKNPQFKNQSLTITRSPEPSDILWLNCEKQFNYCKLIVIWFMTFFILYCGYAIVSFTQTLSIFKKIDHVIVTIILQLLNRLIWFYLSIVVSYEDNNTRTETIISSVKKSIIAQTVNIIVNPIISKFINNKDLYGFNGLAGMALTYQFVMLGMMLIYYIFNPFYLGKKFLLKMPCTRRFIVRYLCRMTGKLDTHEEVKPVFEFYEGPQFPVAGAYVYMTTAIFHAMFYSYLQPIILLVVAINTSALVVIMKYMLLRRCKIPDLTRIQIFEYAIFLLSLAPAYFISGSIFFSLVDEDNKNRLLSLICPIVCLVLWIGFILNFFSCRKFMNKLIEYLVQYDIFSKKRKNKKLETRKDHLLFQLGSWAGPEILDHDFRRRQTYYMDSPVNELLDFQFVLKGFKDKNHVEQKGRSLKQFCEKFCQQMHHPDRKNIRDSSLKPMCLEISRQAEGNENTMNNVFCLIPVQNITEKEGKILNSVINGYILKPTSHFISLTQDEMIVKREKTAGEHLIFAEKQKPEDEELSVQKLFFDNKAEH